MRRLRMKLQVEIRKQSNNCVWRFLPIPGTSLRILISAGSSPDVEKQPMQKRDCGRRIRETRHSLSRRITWQYLQHDTIVMNRCDGQCGLLRYALSNQNMCLLGRFTFMRRGKRKGRSAC